MPLDIKGYDFGAVGTSPVSLEELKRLRQTTGFGDAEEAALRRAAKILVPQAESMVDEWREIIGKQEHLAHWFVGPDGKADQRYKSAIKPRFVQWVCDLCTRPFDQAWLDYQEEIGLRHTPAKKNLTESSATPPLVPLRYLLAFLPPVQHAAYTRLEASGADRMEIAAMQRAWMMAVMLSLALWTRPYTAEGLW